MDEATAKTLHQYLVRSTEREFELTKKVLSAVPEGKRDYKPDPRSKSAFDLAKHIASAEVKFLEGVARGAFVFDKNGGDSASTVAELVSWYSKTMPSVIEQLKGLTPAKLVQEIDFGGRFKFPAVEYEDINIRHIVHHRGQLTAYLRPMGGTVPAVYGPSADEQGSLS